MLEGLRANCYEDLVRNASEVGAKKVFGAVDIKYLNLKCQGYPMGSRLFSVPRKFIVKARDESGDTFKQVRLYRDRKLIKKKAVSGNPIRERLLMGPGVGKIIIYWRDSVCRSF